MRYRVHPERALVVAMGALAVLVAAAPVPADLDELNSSVVKIHARMTEFADEIGAGIIVRLDGDVAYILTAHHVVDGAESIEVELHDDPVRRYAAQVHRFEEALDIAVIYVEDDRLPAELPAFDLADPSLLAEAASVTAIGHQPGDLDWQLSRETVTRVNAPRDPRNFLFSHGGIQPGNSGGPIFLADDALVGIVVSRDPGHAVAVKIDAALAYLDHWRVPAEQLKSPATVAEGPDEEGDAAGSGDEPVADVVAFGMITVETSLPAAGVYLGREKVGETRDGVLALEDLEPGQYELWVRQTGYKSWQDTVEVKANREILVKVELQKAESAGGGSGTSSTGTFVVQDLRLPPPPRKVLSAGARARIESECYDKVQGKIAWDYSGNKRWAESNAKRLCKGTSDAAQPPACFNRVMHGRINHGNGTRWTWQAAIDLCEGTSDARKTITCFQNRIRRGGSQQDAVKACS